MSRTLNIAEGEYYHIFNRGSERKDIFLDDRDYVRFLFLIVYLQSPKSFNNMSRHVSQYVKSSAFNITENSVSEIVKKRDVELVTFCLMPNHFHLLLRNVKESGVAKYLHRIQTAYSKYFNTKYKVNGHLFQGAYKAVHGESNDQVLYLSTYIHKNPVSLVNKQSEIFTYPWSSLTDYLHENRWGNLLAHEIISEQFDDQKEYKEFVKSSTAKEKFSFLEELLEDQEVVKC